MHVGWIGQMDGEEEGICEQKQASCDLCWSFFSVLLIPISLIVSLILIVCVCAIYIHV